LSIYISSDGVKRDNFRQM